MRGTSGGNNMSIGQLLAEVVAKHSDNEQIYSVVGTVTEINEDERTVDIEPNNGDAAIIGARLQSSESLNTGVVAFPSKGSEVIVTFLNENTGIVTGYSNLSSLAIKTEVDSLKDVLLDLITAIQSITVTTPGGPSTLPLINDAQFVALKDRVDKFLKQ